MFARTRSRYLVTLFCCLAAGVAALSASPAALAQEPAKKPAPTFAVGEKVEVWWAGKYLPGEIAAVEDKGWVQVKFSLDGREQTIKQRGDGEWVRKAAAAKPEAGPAATPRPRPRPAAAPAAAPANVPGFGAGKPAGAPGDGNPFATPEEAAMRTWSDSTGRFKIEARFEGKDGDNVLLTRADGKTIKLPLAKLSQADQDHIASLGAPPMPENPFETAPEVATAGGIDRQPDYSETEQVIPQPTDGWSLVPDAVAEAAGLPPRAVGISTPGSGNDRFFETPNNLFLDPAKGQAVAVLVNGPPGKEREVRFVRADLAGGKVAGEVRVNTSFTPADLSPSGSLVACLPDTFAKNESEKNKIAIFRLEQNGLVPVIRWSMGEGVEFAKKFERLAFVSEDKLLGVSPFGGAVTLFDVNLAKALWTLKITGNCAPAFSANRAQFAAAVDGGIAIFSTANAETLARINTTAPIQGGVLSISPNGKRLAHCTNSVIYTWDLTTGQPLHEVWFPRVMQANSVDWITDSLALVDRQHLVDLDKRIILWRYELPGGGQPIARQAGGRLWLLTGGHNNPIQVF
jgi:hypothetical protein